MKKGYLTAAKIVAVVIAIIFGITIVGGNIITSSDVAGQINDMFGIQQQVRVDDEDAGTDTLYYKSDYTSIADLKENANEVVADVTAEGAVLLKNDNDALPLSAGASINLYSSSSVNYIYQGGGSSYARRADVTDLKEGLEMSGFKVNGDLWQWYSDNTSYFGDHNSNTSSDAASYAINDAPWSVIDSAKNDEAEAGIFVLSRYGTEATDNYMSGGSASDATNGDYLELSPNEISVLVGMKGLKDEGKIQKIIVLLNSVNQVQCDYVDDEAYGIDAVLWVGEGGASGTVGIGRILAGESPSGRLTDTFWREHHYNPVYSNFGEYAYSGETISGGTKSNKYVVYQEGIYNGYKYTETRYEDVVLGRANVGDFVYSDVVAYPFGYGLSYTAFEYSNFDLSYDAGGDVYTIAVTVTNAGETEGKNSVQVYLQKPYTDYDVENGIEKASVELVGYAKTDVLAKGEGETVKIDIDGEWLASYDAYGEGTYIMDEGDYYFAVGSDAHDALNNILALKSSRGVSVNESKMTSSGDSSLADCIEQSFDWTTYSVSSETGNDIENRFDDVDINRYSGRGANSVKYITRNDWNGTVKLGFTKDHSVTGDGVSLTATSQMVTDSQKASNTLTEDDVEYPDYGIGNYEMGLGSLLTILDGELEHVDYDDPLWEDILDELTWDDTVLLLSNGLRKTYGIAIKPQTIDANGSLGPVGATSSGDDAYRYSSNRGAAEYRYAFLYDDPDQETSPVMYPCAALLAATCDDELVEKLGESIGEDCLWAGYSGLYGPGLNIHRGAYNGRAFEYYSEDSMLSGLASSAEIRGIQSKGVYVYLKHAVLNDQEHNREGVNTWANEQTIREGYLRSFEIAIEKGGASNIMTGFNRLGVKWTSSHGFINTVLRGEFGMDGFGVTDYWQSGYMDQVGSILGGCALPDGDLATSGASSSALYKYSQGYGSLAWTMREEVHRILYQVVNSNAMNGVSASTRYISVTPSWIGAVRTVQIVISVLFGLCMAVFVAVYVAWYVSARRSKKKEDANEDEPLNLNGSE